MLRRDLLVALVCGFSTLAYGAGAVTETYITSLVISGVAPADWSSSFVAWWDEEEANGATALNHAGTTCGSDCNLTDTNTVTRDTTNFVEGIKAANFVGASNQYQDCADATCDELDCGADPTLTFGLWLRPVDLTVTRRTIGNYNNIDAGYQGEVTTTGALNCTIGDGGALVTASSATSTAASSTWVHYACKLSMDVIQVYANGVASGSPAPQHQCFGETQPFRLSSTSTTVDMDARVDEPFMTHKALTTAQICRVCSLGIDGSYGLCDGLVPTEYRTCSTDADCQTFSAHGKCDTTSGTCQGRNHSTNPGCGGCALTACNATAP